MSAGSSSAASPQVEDFEVSSVRFNWQLKAILPVVFVLLAGLLLFIRGDRIFAGPGTPRGADRSRERERSPSVQC